MIMYSVVRQALDTDLRPFRRKSQHRHQKERIFHGVYTKILVLDKLACYPQTVSVHNLGPENTFLQLRASIIPSKGWPYSDFKNMFILGSNTTSSKCRKP